MGETQEAQLRPKGSHQDKTQKPKTATKIPPHISLVPHQVKSGGWEGSKREALLGFLSPRRWRDMA